MNNAELLRQSEIFAERVVADAGNEVAAQVRRAWRLALSTDPTAEEINHSLTFLAAQKGFAVQQISELTPEESTSTLPCISVARLSANGSRF